MDDLCLLLIPSEENPAHFLLMDCRFWVKFLSRENIVIPFYEVLPEQFVSRGCIPPSIDTESYEGWLTFPFLPKKKEESISSCALRLLGKLTTSPPVIKGIKMMTKTAFKSSNEEYSMTMFLTGPVQKEDNEIMNNCQWYSLTSIHRAHRTRSSWILGREVIDVFESFSDEFLSANDPTRYLPAEMFRETRFTLCPITGDLSKMTGSQQVLAEAKIGADEQRYLYDEFIKFSYPYSSMSLPQFAGAMISQGVAVDNLYHYFRAIDYHDRKFLTLSDFMLGMIALDAATTHGRKCGELRCRFIFRFYDQDEDGLLSFAEFKALIRDICVAKGWSLEDKFVDKKAREQAKVFGEEISDKLSEDTFLYSVGSLKFRGTSTLFRLPFSPIQKFRKLKRQHDSQRKSRADSSAVSYTSPPMKRYRESMTRMDDDNNNPSPPALSASPAVSVDGSAAVVAGSLKDTDTESLDEDDKNGIVLAREVSVSGRTGGFEPDSSSTPNSGDQTVGKLATRKNYPRTGAVTFDEELQNTGNSSTPYYELAIHTVKVRRSGSLADVSCIWEMGKMAVSSSSETDLLNSKSRVDRTISIDTFNPKSHANEMLNGLRYFKRQVNKGDTEKAAFEWGSVERAALATCLMAICDQVSEIMIGEPRLLKLRSPTYILGDIHGNFRDLTSFEKALWRMGPSLSPANFLFLGDYVDRGPHGVEVVAYLFAQKLIAPTKFYLLRGNHEVRHIQEAFTFHRECLEKFGDSLGKRVWERINSVFDLMPLAATIDDKIFCIHGGIPRPCLYDSVDDINLIPTPLEHPDVRSDLAWEIMWSDPVSAEKDGEDSPSGDSNDGFVPNAKRGTAYCFSTEALTKFLERNGFSHVIRAHEMHKVGFQVQQKARLLTVFSSSHYCNTNNEAACVMADQGKLRLLRLDTS